MWDKRNIIRGFEIENALANEIRSKVDSVIQNHTWGIDLIIQNKNKIIKVEVKSAKLWVKNGKKGYRKGRFIFASEKLGRPDYFAFVINKNYENITYWVKAQEVKDYFKDSKSKKVSLGIPALMNRFNRIDFSEVIK